MGKMRGVALACLVALLSGVAVAQSDDKLNIWLVAHSHDDTGWLRTIDEYYIYEVQYILDSVVDSLAANPNRKFIEVEMAFFTRWWREQTAEKQAQVRGLVQAGQLEFVNGGWCMNDEAVPTYYQFIDQMTLGHEFLQETFDDAGKPSIGWHIDPFGHSGAMAVLFNLTGFDAFITNRIDYREKDAMKLAGDLEFTWQGSPSLGDRNTMWSHMMDEHYCTPTGFNWEHGVTQNLPYGDGPPPIVFDPPSEMTKSNAFERAQEFVTEAYRRAKSYKTNNILIPFGCDFTFQNANMMFKNMDRLIDAVNMYSEELNATARYSTLSDYTAHVRSIPASAGKTITKDFFPYADNRMSYWTGYFTSRPNLKSKSRTAHSLLRAADSLHSLARARYSMDTANYFDELFGLRAVESVIQHHDGTTGTHREIVGDDYNIRIDKGLEVGGQLVADMLSTFVTNMEGGDTFFADNERMQSELAAGRSVYLVLQNPLGWTRKTVASIPLGDQFSVSVKVAATGADADAALIIETDFSGSTLYLRDTFPGLGYVTYLITPAKALAHGDRLVPIAETMLRVESIANEYVQLVFNDDTLMLESITLLSNNTPVNIKQEFLKYTSYTSGQTSGAYILRPKGDAVVLGDGSVGSFQILNNSIVTEVRQEIVPGVVSQVIRIYHGLDELEGSAVEIIPMIGPLSPDNEIITRFTTSIDNGDVFYTDDNGLEMQRRVNLPEGRPDDADRGVVIGGNYYPAVSRALIRDESADGFTVAVASQSTHGAASLFEGTLELMLHRRCSRDDARGMSEPLDDTSVYTGYFKLLVSENSKAARLHVRHSNALNFPIGAVYGLDTTPILNPTLSPIKADLPENVHIVSFSPRNTYSDQVVLRLLNPFETGADSELSQPVSVTLQDILSDPWALGTVQQHTLTLLNAVGPASPPGTDVVVTLRPIDLVTYIVDLSA